MNDKDETKNEATTGGVRLEREVRATPGYSTTIGIRTYFRDSTSEWISEFTYIYCGENVTCRYPGTTELEALYASLAAMPGKLLESTWNREP